jgi:hypothetical protein
VHVGAARDQELAAQIHNCAAGRHPHLAGPADLGDDPAAHDHGHVVQGPPQVRLDHRDVGEREGRRRSAGLRGGGPGDQGCAGGRAGGDTGSEQASTGETRSARACN